MSAANKMNDLPLMPKATAVWLVENTALTFDQIAEFCGMHPMEVQGIADGEVAHGMLGQDPVALGQITKEVLEKAEADPKVKLELAKSAKSHLAPKTKGARYTPIARRADKPDAIAWLLRNHPALKDSQIVKLIGTTKSTIEAIRNRTHWNHANLRPRDPVLLGLCTQTALDKAAERARFEQEKAGIVPTPTPEADSPAIDLGQDCSGDAE